MTYATAAKPGDDPSDSRTLNTSVLAAEFDIFSVVAWAMLKAITTSHEVPNH